MLLAAKLRVNIVKTTQLAASMAARSGGAGMYVAQSIVGGERQRQGNCASLIAGASGTQRTKAALAA